MPRPSAKTKEELLVENAILKSHEHVRGLLKEELAPFTKTMKEIDKRLDIVEMEVSEIKDVIAPFSIIRRRFWFMIIALSLVIGILSSEFITWVNNLIK